MAPVALHSYVSTCPTSFRPPRCVFWDVGFRRWSGEGCTLHEVSNKAATCRCTHLSDMAASFAARRQRFAAVLGHIDDITVEEVVASLPVIIGLSVLLIILWTLLVMGCIWDRRDRAKFLAKVR